MGTYTNFAIIAAGCLVTYFLISTIVTYIENYRFAKKHGCKPPRLYPQTERIIGFGHFRDQVAQAKNKVTLSTGLKKFREIGNTHTAVTLGTKLYITIDPENIKAVLATNFQDFGLGERVDAMGPLLGQGIFTSDGAHWEHSRALVRPSFTKAQVADLGSFETHIQKLIARIPRDGSTFDLQTLFFQLTLDSATDFLLGESLDTLSKPIGSREHLFGQIFDSAQHTLSYRLRLGPMVWMHRSSEFNEQCKHVHNFIDPFVQKALEFRREHLAGGGSASDEKRKGKYIFMNELALATNDPIQIRSEILNLLLAGRDTTAGLLSNTFHTFARRPDIWAKVTAEVDQLEGKAPDYETLRNMKYLKYVLNESLRLFPSVPSNGRFANKNTVLPTGGGPDGKSPIFIPKDGIVVWSPFCMHRRKDFYGEDADEYRPERWETLRVGWEYLPFNGGPRICIGQQFALTEAGYTIVRLVQEFKSIESRDDRPWAEGLHLTLSSGHGVLVSVQPRS